MNKPVEQFQSQQVNNRESPMIDLPWIYRVLHIEREHLINDIYLNTAELFHDRAALSVTWGSREGDAIISAGMLVQPLWENDHYYFQGSLRVKSVTAITCPSQDVNLFETIPFDWVKDRKHIQEAKEIISSLPAHFSLLFAAIFWDNKRFYRFLVGPSSINGHHNWRHGNFIHTIEVVNNAIKIAENQTGVCLGVLMIAALLHDAAKADEYEYNRRRSCFEISTRGALIGHKMTIIEWIAAAIAQYQISIPNNQYLGLLHALTAVKSCPEWVGLREPRSPECHLLSIADRLSGQDDLLQQTMPVNGGFGQYHKHLKGRPYLIHSPSS